MKQKSTIILSILIAIILVTGTVMIAVKGLAFELKYQDTQKVELNIGKEFKTEDVKQITNEVFEKQPVIIQAIEVYKDAISITTTEITEEQKQKLVTKINEKYQTELKSEDIIIESIPHTRGRDIIKPYITPFATTTVIILGYLMIKYHKLNSFKVLLQSVGIIVLAQMVLLGIMAITRMPIGKFTIPMVLLVYMISTYVCTEKLEKNLEDKKVTKEN